jgi:hypothetical protein
MFAGVAAAERILVVAAPSSAVVLRGAGVSSVAGTPRHGFSTERIGFRAAWTWIYLLGTAPSARHGLAFYRRYS